MIPWRFFAALFLIFGFEFIILETAVVNPELRDFLASRGINQETMSAVTDPFEEEPLPHDPCGCWNGTIRVPNYIGWCFFLASLICLAGGRWVKN
jgi:hypothetical protein